MAQTYFDVVPKDINNYLIEFCEFQLAEIDLKNRCNAVFIIGPRRCGKSSLIEKILQICPHSSLTLIRDDDLFPDETKTLQFHYVLRNRRHLHMPIIIATNSWMTVKVSHLNEFDYIIVFWSPAQNHNNMVCRLINEKYRVMCRASETMVFDRKKELWVPLANFFI